MTETVRSARGRNPVLPPDVHVPDGEARCMPDGRLYLYGSLDESEATFCSPRYRVASTPDLVEWTVHETSFTTADVPWAGGAPSSGRSFLEGVTSYDELPRHVVAMLPPGSTEVPFEEFAAAVRAETAARQPAQTLLYAPDVIERDDRYHLFFCASDDTEGVAVADAPTGPFRDAVRLPVTGIDPSVFIDDDGAAYLYWGQFSASVARLGPDLRTVDTSTIVHDVLTEAEHHFHEGCSMRKRGDIYYLVFADTSRGRPTALGYATSDSPTGPFSYRGVIVDNAACDPASWNNHGSIEEFRARWYVFYHRSSRGVASMRRACVEPIEFAPDGSIPEVLMTSQGAGEPYHLDERIPAREACEVTGDARIAPHGGDDALHVGAGGGGAVFRYLDVAGAVDGVRVDADGAGPVDLLVDGAPVATLRPGRREPVRLARGRYEIALRVREADGLVITGLTFMTAGEGEAGC